MSFLGTTATAVATAVTTTALVLPLLSWSPSHAYRYLLHGRSARDSRSDTSSLCAGSSSSECKDTGECSKTAEQGIGDEVALTSRTWMADLFLTLLEAAPSHGRIPVFKQYCAFVALLHAMSDTAMKDLKESQFERTSVDVALEEDEAERLLQYFNFATWARDCADSVIRRSTKQTKTRNISLQEKLRRKGYNIIRHVQADDTAGVLPSHFMAVYYEKKEVVISISFGCLGGTQMDSVLQSIRSGVNPRRKLLTPTEAEVREDLMVTAKILSDEIFHMVENFFMPNGFRVVLCGHSLGAGVASLLGILWNGICIKRSLKIDLHVFAFGPPPCVSADSCAATKRFITTIVNNNDILPRLSPESLTSLETILVLVDRRLKICSLSPRDMSLARQNVVDILKLSPKAILTPEDMPKLSCTCVSVGDGKALIVPGSVLCMWNHTQDASILGVNSPVNGSLLVEGLSIDQSMIVDHTECAYRANLELLVEQTANTI
jgi:Lipase (class 3)